MTTYTSVFGNDTIPPSENSYVAVSLTADTVFSWPELSSSANLLADTMDIASDGTWAMTMPSATEVSVGRSVIFNNTSAFNLVLKDSAGNALGTLDANKTKCLYLATNATAAGTWTLIEMGAGTNVVDAAVLAGYGLKVTTTTLSQDYPAVILATGVTLDLTDRAKTRIFTGSGAITCALPQALFATNGFFVNLSNQSSGSVTIDPNGTETVDGQSTKELAPGESATVVCDGMNWVTIGYGRSTQFQFTKLVLDVSTGSPFTLTSTQAQNKLIQFIGAVTANVVVNVPAVVAIYYIENSYTGSFNLTLKTAAGGGIVLQNTDRAIAYCDGVDVVLAQTSSVPATSLAGGVAGAIPYQTGPGTTGFSAAGTTGQLVLSGGIGAPTFSTIGAIEHAASLKATPIDADEVSFLDSTASFVIVRATWANVKAFLKAYFDTLYSTAATVASYVSGLIGTTIQAYDANTAKLNVLQSWSKAQRGSITALTDAATVAIDASLSNNFSLLTTSGIGATRKLGNPTNLAAGQSGIIAVTTDAVGRLLTFDTYYKFAGGTAPTLSATSGAIDYFSYYAETATRVFISQAKDVK